MKRIIIMMMAVTCLGVMAIAQDVMEEQVEQVKKEKKVKAPKVKKEKKPKAPKPPKEAKEKKPKAPKPIPEEMTISGVITKVEVKKGEKVAVKFVLTDTEGNKITLPKPKKPKKGDEAAQVIKLEDYVDSAVKVTGTGIKTPKGVMLKSVTAIAKGEEAADIEIFPKDDEVEDEQGDVE